MRGVAFHLRAVLDHLVYEEVIVLTDTNVFIRIAPLVSDFMENDRWNIEIPIKGVNQVNLLRSRPDKSYTGISVLAPRPKRVRGGVIVAEQNAWSSLKVS